MPFDDEDSGSRLKRVARKYKGRLLKTRKDLADRDQLLTELADEHEELQKTNAATTKERDELKASKKKDAVRKAFDSQASKANVDPEYADDLFKLLDLTDAGEGDDVDEKAVKKAILEGVKNRPYMIKKPKPDPEDGEGDEDVDNDTSEEEGDGETDDEAPAPAKTGKLKPETKPMTKGEGNGRGGRTNLKPTTMDEQIDADFADTGRTDPFRI